MKYVDDASAAVLQDLVRRELHRRQEQGSSTVDIGPEQAPDRYVAKVPEGGIPARSGLTLGKATCALYKAVESGDDWVLEDTTVERDIFNIYLMPVVDPGGNDSFVQVERDKFGRWLVERPSGVIAVTTEAIPQGDSGAVNVVLGDGTRDTAEYTVHDLILNNGESIPVCTKIEFFEYGGRLIWRTAYCQPSDTVEGCGYS